MRHRIILSIACLVSCYSLSVLAKETPVWKGELFGIMPNAKKVTLEYCKSHAFDTYQTTAAMVDKEITADNGVKSRNINHTITQIGGVYLEKGSAMFSGIINGKAWQEKVRYYGQSLFAKDGMRQGIWYSKNCKGFYKVGPV